MHPDVTYVVARAPDRRGTFVVAEPLRGRRPGRGGRGPRPHAGPRLGVRALPAAVRAGRLPRGRLPEQGSHFVVLADYVTTEDGTGLVHQSPAFGADDLAVCRGYGLPVVNPIDPTGHFLPDVPLVGGHFFKAADAALVEDLKNRGVLFRELRYEHSYPHCWRCHTPLMYYAQPSWYIRTSADQGPAARREREDELVPGEHQARPLRRLAEQQRRLGAVPRPVLGHAAADLAQRRRPDPDGRRRLAGRALGADRPGPRRPRPAPAVHRRRHLHPARRGGHLPAGPPGHRRLVRLRLDAVRPVGRAAPQQRGVRGRLPGAVHLPRRSTRPAAGSTR